MASKISASIVEEFVEVRLFSGLRTGILLHHKELLDMLEDVDVRGVQQKTLLHEGVRLGKADWVEELLARGADPQLTDDTHDNAVSLAEEMVLRFPQDLARSEVLKLVSLVHRRDKVISRRLEASSSRSSGHMTPVASPEQNIVSLKSTVDALRQEMKSLFCELSSSLEELKAQVCERYALLRSVEELVTSTAEDVTSNEFGVGGEAVVRPSPFNPAIARQECVDAMLRRTTIVYGDGEDVMRRLYERLYDEDDCTACIIKYMSGDDRVKVMVDCESDHIGRMKDKFVDFDGTQWNGSGLFSFCDVEDETVYLSTKVGSGESEKVVGALLARALSQLSLKLVFGNGGCPYEQGNAERECEWMRAMEEVKERRMRGGIIDSDIIYALNHGTQLAKVCYLAAVVPQIVTIDGSSAGRTKLQEQVPRLLSLYTNHVTPTLLAKAR